MVRLSVSRIKEKVSRNVENILGYHVVVENNHVQTKMHLKFEKSLKYRNVC